MSSDMDRIIATSMYIKEGLVYLFGDVKVGNGGGIGEWIQILLLGL